MSFVAEPVPLAAIDKPLKDQKPAHNKYFWFWRPEIAESLDACNRPCGKDDRHVK